MGFKKTNNTAHLLWLYKYSGRGPHAEFYTTALVCESLDTLRLFLEKVNALVPREERTGSAPRNRHFWTRSVVLF